MKQRLTTIQIALLVLIIQLGFTTETFAYTKSINTRHHYQQTDHWCGPTSTRMIMECDTIANTPGRRAGDYPTGTNYQIQQALWSYIRANNSTVGIWYTDPDGLQATLDHYDTAQPYVQYTNSNAAWSCRKLAWTIEHYEVPPAILINSGAHWIVVFGVNTDVAPTETGTYQIKGFWLRDPGYWSSALGSNTYRSYNNFICFFNTLNVPGAWNGLRVSVCDPDVVTADIIEPPPLPDGPLITPEQAITAAFNAIGEHDLYADPNFALALDTAVPFEPVLMDWPFCGIGNCYGVPFVKDDKLTGVIVVYGVDGQLMEASCCLDFDEDDVVGKLERFYQELTYPFIPRESSARPGESVPAPAISTPDPRPVIKINFQPGDATVPYGYLVDIGLPFDIRLPCCGPEDGGGVGYRYGWNMVTDETRERDSHTDQRLDTLIHMQKPSNPYGIWEIDLQNGFYKVLLVCGDPNYRNQTNNIDVERTILLDDDPWDGIGSTKGYDFDVWETLVKVTDGRLTIQPADGAYNAKICFVRVTPTMLDLDEGLVAYLNCNEGEGTVAYDFSTTWHADLIGGTSWDVGPLGFGAALGFNGENAYVETGKTASALSINGNSARTVSAWVYTRSFNEGGIFEVGETTLCGDFSLRTTPWDDRWRMQIWGGSGYDVDFNYSSKNKWVHFAFVYDGTRAKIYADGDPNVDVARTLNTGDGKTFKIGRWEPYSFDGLIDEVHIYDRALSQVEIEQLMTQEQEGPRENVNFGNSTCPGATNPVSAQIDSANNAVELRCEGSAFNLYYIDPGIDGILKTPDDDECHIATCSYAMGENASQVMYDSTGEFAKVTFWNYEGHINHEPSKPVADYVDNSFENRDTYIYYPAGNTLKVKKELRALDSKGRSDPGKPWIPNFNKPNPTQQVADYCGQSPPNTLPDPCMASNGVYVTTLQFTGEIEGNGQIEIIINDVPVLVTTQPDTGVNELVQLLVQEFNNQWGEEPFAQQGKLASQDPNFLQIVQLRNVVPEEIEVRIIDEPNLQYNFYPYPHSNYTLEGDANEDGKINFIDFAIIAENWLVNCFETPWHPACAPSAQPIEIPRFE